MLRISERQMAAFEASAETRFRKRVGAFIRDCVDGARNADPEALQIDVDRLIAAARAHDITWQRNLAEYVQMAFEFGEAFADAPEVTRAMAGPPESADARFLTLRERVPDFVWKRLSQAQQVPGSL